MVRPTIPDPEPTPGLPQENEVLSLDDIDDASLAAELGVFAQAKPVEPLPDSQIPSTQPFDYFVGDDLPQDGAANKTEPVEVPSESNSEVVVENQHVDLPQPDAPMNPDDSISTTEIEATPSPNKVVEVVESQEEIQTRVLPPKNPQPVSPEDLADLRAKIAAVK